MPLTAQTTDLFQKVGLPGSATTLSSPGYTIGNASITVGATTNHPSDTKYTFAIDQAQVVNGVTSRIPGTYCEFEGILGGGNTIGSLTLKYGSAQNYPAGALTRVYIPVSANRENQLIVGLRQDHNGKGNHQSLTDDNGNIWLERSQTASAVNNLRVQNQTTGNGVVVDANGSDTNINLHLRGKGTGVAVAENPELISNFVASGGVVAISSGLIGTFSDLVLYSGGKRYKKTSVPNKTYTISKDTYVDADPTNSSTVVYTEVANNAASPALTSGYVRIAKVITNGTIISSIVQSGYDTVTTSGQVNPIYNTDPNAVAVFTYVNAGTAGGTFYYRTMKNVKEVWGISNAVTVSGTGTGVTASYIINFPASFFLNTPTTVATVGPAINSAAVTHNLAAISTANAQVYIVQVAGTNGGGNIHLYARGW